MMISDPEELGVVQQKKGYIKNLVFTSNEMAVNNFK